LEEDGVDERVLPDCPTTGDWTLSLPCPEEDLKWVARRLAQLSDRVVARDMNDEVEGTGSNGVPKGRARSMLMDVDLEEYLKP
jgi:hypothetical protein